MKVFPYAHATHPQWQMAASLVLAQLRAQLASPSHFGTPTLALLYVTDHYASSARELLDYLSAELPTVTDWSGTVGVGIAANNVEYFDEPALAVMLLELPSDQYRVFSGVAPLGLGFEAHTALVHADGDTADLGELLKEMSERTDSGYLFGGLASSRGVSVQFSLAADGNVRGQGHAGVAFAQPRHAQVGLAVAGLEVGVAADAHVHLGAGHHRPHAGFGIGPCGGVFGLGLAQLGTAGDFG
jgi:small ligand-binding sensory domain FIST